MGDAADITYCAKFHPMPETEVFVNNGGGITISQRGDDGYDQIVVFPAQMAGGIVKAILEAAEAAQRETTD